MDWFPESKDHLPLTWWKQKPVYLAAVIALGGVASMVLTTLIMAVNPAWLEPLTFSLDHLLRGWVWTPLTYILVNPPDLWFLLTSYLLYTFGEAMERHLGRRSFVKLILALVLVTPLLLSLIGLAGPRNWPAFGMGQLEFGVFLAFAALYPTARVSIIILTLEVWMLATAFVVISALMSLASHEWAALFILAGQVGTAVGYIRYEQGTLRMPPLRLWSKKTKTKAKTKTVTFARQGSAAKPAPAPKEQVMDVDAILDKISHQGIASLTSQEKQALEKASERLGKKGR
ncbi:MAG: hypothetical protein JWO94_1436 [Verrucomicrobiaceae bacterium]|nr:hypothetical protein [Verrucomicrobiaceae bacterium]